MSIKEPNIIPFPHAAPSVSRIGQLSDLVRQDAVEGEEPAVHLKAESQRFQLLVDGEADLEVTTEEEALAILEESWPEMPLVYQLLAGYATVDEQDLFQHARSVRDYKREIEHNILDLLQECTLNAVDSQLVIRYVEGLLGKLRSINPKETTAHQAQRHELEMIAILVEHQFHLLGGFDEETSLQDDLTEQTTMVLEGIDRCQRYAQGERPDLVRTLQRTERIVREVQDQMLRMFQEDPDSAEQEEVRYRVFLMEGDLLVRHLLFDEANGADVRLSREDDLLRSPLPPPKRQPPILQLISGDHGMQQPVRSQRTSSVAMIPARFTSCSSSLTENMATISAPVALLHSAQLCSSLFTGLSPASGLSTVSLL